jgi:hypothetical protein
MAVGTRTLMVKFAGEATGLKKAADEATSKLDKGRAAWGKLGKAATVGALAVAAGVAAWGVSTAKALMEIERLSAQTDSAIESMNVAWTNTAEIESYAASIEKVTGIEAELVQEGQNLLLTFGNIQNVAGKGNDIFDRTTGIMADMSTALGQGMTSSATQLGKALNDPIKGVTALQRVGVSFTESQRDTIKALVESGDTLGAQKLILKELEAQFGGSAAAFGKTMPGQIAKAKNAFGEMSEKLLVSLMPTIDSLVSKFQTLTDWMMRNQDAVKAIGITVVALAGAILAINAALAVWRAAVVVATAVQWLWNIAMLANPIVLIVLAIIALVAIIVVVATKTQFFQKLWHAIWSKIGDPVKAIWNWIKNNWPLLLAIITGPIGLAVLFVVRNFDKIKAGAGRVKDFITSIPSRIKSAFSRLGEIITAPFRAGFEAVKQIWNNTIGGKGFNIPSWVPLVGGKSFRFPRFHSGGVVPGPLGREVPILARAGERVLTREQDLAGGDTNVTVIIDGRAIDESLVRVVRSRDRGLKRRVRAGSGAFA